MDIGDIDTNLVVLFSLNTSAESHRLGLTLAERIEGCDRLHTLVGRKDGGEASIRVVLEFLDCNTTAKAAPLRQFACVIEEIGMSPEIGYATMIGKRFRVGKRHDLTSIGPWSRRSWSSTIGNMFRNTACGIEELV